MNDAFRECTLLLYAAANFEKAVYFKYVCTAAVYTVERTISMYSRAWLRNTTTVYETKGVYTMLANGRFGLSSLGLASGLGFVFMVIFRLVRRVCQPL